MKKVSDLFDSDLKKRATYNKSSHNRSRFSKSSSNSGDHDFFNFLELIARWPEIVGEKLAKVTVPLKHQNQCLTLLTNHSAYSQQLSLLEETLRAKIIRSFPQLQGKIKKFRFQVSTTHFDAQREDLLKRANSNLSQTKTQNVAKHLHPQSPEYKKLKKEASEEFEFLSKDLEEDVTQSLMSLYIQQKEKDLLK